MSRPKCRWGFLSTAEIGQKNWQAVHRSGNGIVRGVASRNPESAQRFIDLCQREYPFDNPPQAVGTYDALLESDEIDAVYVPLPTGLRKEWVIRAAQAGKHVICEKPCAIQASDLSEMLEACEKHGVQFMDGVMFMHSARLAKLREILDDEASVGQVKRIATQFSFNAPDEFRSHNIRTDSSLEPHGCLGDLGWYTIRFALWVMDGRMPTTVTGRILASLHRDGSPGPVPMEFSGELFFDGEASASFYCSFQTHHQQWANISGTRGHVTINDFVLPYFGNQLSLQVQNADFVVDACDFRMERKDTIVHIPEFSHGADHAQETNMFRRMNEIVLSGQLDQAYPAIALRTQRVLDACFASAMNGATPQEPTTP